MRNTTPREYLSVGNYENSTLTLSNDGSDGTVVVDPPASGDPANSARPAAGGSGLAGRGGTAGESLIFKSGFDSLLATNSTSSAAAEWHDFAEFHAETKQLAHNETNSLIQKVAAANDTGLVLGQHDGPSVAHLHFAELHPNNKFIGR